MAEGNNLKILNWAEEDRPREKLLLKGKRALSDAELIAILIGSGTRQLSAVDLGKLILQQSNNDLNQLAKLTVKDLQKIKGIGEAKAISIVSALELGRRRKAEDFNDRPRILKSEDAYNLMKPELKDLNVEEFWVIFLNRANSVIGKQLVSTGGIDGTVVDIRLVFKAAIEQMAGAIIAVHNHPSGNLQPSAQDKQITSNLKEAGTIMKINLLDHIIFTNQGHFSFADEGMM